MLTKKQFRRLKAGDIVLCNGKPRTVREVTWRDSPQGGRGFITFSILHRSWTGRISTTYGYNDIKRLCSLPRRKRDRRSVCAAEEASLLANGFNVPSEVNRELANELRILGLGLGTKTRQKDRRDGVALLKQTRRKLKRRKADQ